MKDSASLVTKIKCDLFCPLHSMPPYTSYDTNILFYFICSYNHFWIISFHISTIKGRETIGNIF